MNITQIIDRSLQLLAEGKVKDVLKTIKTDLLKEADSIFKETYIATSSSYYLNKERFRHGLIHAEEYQTIENRVVDALISLLNSWLNNVKGEAGNSQGNSLYLRIDERQENWEILERIAIDSVITGGTTGMGFYRDAWRTQKEIGGDEKNPSTLADIQSTLAIIHSLEAKFPLFSASLNAELTYFGEETASELSEKNQQGLSNATIKRIKSDKDFFDDKRNTIKVIFDAIDGTNSFSRGIPLFCSCLAILIDNIPRVSAIYDPVHHVVYSAVLKGSDLEPSSRSSAYSWHVGIGVRENLKLRSEKSKEIKLKNEPLGVHFTRSNKLLLQEFLGVTSEYNVFEQLTSNTKGIYSLNSGVLSMTEVARGALGGFINIVTNPWDVAPAEVLIEAIGGKVTTYNHKDQAIDYKKPGKISVVAARTVGLHDEIFKILDAAK